MNATFESFTSNSTEYSGPLTYGSSVYTIAVFSWVVYAIVFGVGGVLDIFVIYVMLRSGQLRKNFASFLLFHLSVTHLLFHLVIVMNPYRGRLKRDIRSCKAFAFVDRACPAAIFSTLAAIAWDRLKNILQPFKSLIYRPLRSYLIMTGVIWAYAVLSSISFVHSVKVQTFTYCQTENNSDSCRQYMFCDTSQSTWQIQLSETIYFFVAFIMPLSYIAVAYTRIAVRLWNRSKNGAIHSAVAKHKSKSIRLLVVAVFGFVLCWGPSILGSMLDKYEVFDGVPGVTNYFLMVWFMFIAPASSSCVSTAVYAFFCPEFRKNSIKFACCCCCCCCCCKSSRNHRISPDDEIRLQTRTWQTSIRIQQVDQK